MEKVAKQIKDIDTPIYGYWSAFYKSFYSKRLYVDVGKRWRGLGMLYLLLAVLVGCLPFSLRICANFNQMFNQRLIAPLLLIPDIYVQSGQVSFDKPMPYFVKNEEGQVVVIIDTTGTITDFPKEYPKAAILIKKDSFNYKVPTPQTFNFNGVDNPTSSPLVQPFTKTMNFVFNGKQAAADPTLMKLKYLSLSMIYPVIVAVMYSTLLVVFLVLGFLGQLYSRIFFNFAINFKVSIRLFMVAATPALYFFMALLCLNFIFYGLGLAMLALMAVYYSFALYSLRSESRTMVAS